MTGRQGQLETSDLSAERFSSLFVTPNARYNGDRMICRKICPDTTNWMLPRPQVSSAADLTHSMSPASRWQKLNVGTLERCCCSWSGKSCSWSVNSCSRILFLDILWKKMSFFFRPNLNFQQLANFDGDFTAQQLVTVGRHVEAVGGEVSLVVEDWTVHIAHILAGFCSFLQPPIDFQPSTVGLWVWSRWCHKWSIFNSMLID